MTAFSVTWVATFAVRRYAPLVGLLDRPNQRSSHLRATPRGGGLSVIAGVILALGGIQLFVEPLDAAVWIFLGAACLVAAAGLLDDVRGLSPLARLLVQCVAATIVVAAAGPITAFPAPFEHVPIPPALGIAASLVWITTVTNFFNFMDGFDGLATSQAVASCFGILLAGWSSNAALLALITGAACIAFLLHNWTPARVFMGDVGSGFLGFMLAVLPFLAPERTRSTAMLAGAVGLTLFLLDPALTLVRRAAARKRLTESHREHLYQQLAAPGEPIGTIVSVYFVLAVLLAAAGGVGYRRPHLLPWFVLASLITFAALCLVALRAERRKERAR